MMAHEPNDDFELADRHRCIVEKLRAALAPGAASEIQDSPSGTVERVLTLWPSLSFGAKLELLESVDRSCAAALYAAEIRAQPKVIEI
jgi:hypothetical protein